MVNHVKVMSALSGLFVIFSILGAATNAAGQAPPTPSVLLPAPAAAVAFSPDGKTVALGSAVDGTITLWDHTGQPKGNFDHQKRGSVFRLAFSANGKVLEARIADYNDDKFPASLHVWDVHAKKPLFKHDVDLWAALTAQFSPNYTSLAFPDRDGTVTAWDVATNKQKRVYEWKDQSIIDLQYASDGKLLVTTLGQNEKDPHKATVWDAAQNKEIRQVSRASFQVVSPDGKHLVEMVACGPCIGGVLVLRNADMGKPIPLMVHKLGLPVFSPDSKLVCLFSWDNDDRNAVGPVMAQLFDVASAKPLLRIRLSEGKCLAFSPDSKTVAIGGPDHCLLQPLSVFKAFGGSASILSMSPDGKTLATGESNGNVQLSDRATGKLRFKLAAHEKEIQALAFSPDGSKVATGSGDQLVCIWNTQTGRLLHSFNIPRNRDYSPEIRSLIFSKDGKKLGVETPSGGVTEHGVLP
jgi:WD40 repeat protein